MSGASKSIIANVIDPNGVRVELLELPAGSLTREAMERYSPSMRSLRLLRGFLSAEQALAAC